MLAMVAKADTIVPHYNQVPSASNMDQKRVLTRAFNTTHFGFIMGPHVQETVEHIKTLVH